MSGVRKRWLAVSLPLLAAAGALLIVARPEVARQPATATDFATAEAHYARALDLWDRLAGGHEWAPVLAQLEQDAVARGEPATVERSFRRIAALVAKDGRLMAAPAIDRKRTLNDRCHQYVSHVAAQLPAKRDLSITALALAAIARRHGALSVAERYLSLSLYQQERRAPYSLNQARTLHALGMVSWQNARYDSAEMYFGTAIKALEGEIEQLGGPREEHGRHRARYEKLYNDPIAYYLGSQRPYEAFYILELFRARSFLQMLLERDLRASIALPPHLDLERRRIAAAYDRTQRDLAALDPEQDDALEALAEQRQALYRRREALVDEIRRALPELAALHYPRALDGRDTEQALDPGTVLLSYHVGKRTTDLFVVSKARDLRVETLAIGGDALRRAIEYFNQLIATARPGDTSGARHDLRRLGADLYQRLIAPVAGALAASQRLLIVPDGPLHHLPWGALIREGDRGPALERGWQYLAEWKPIHLALSATVYAQLRQRPPHRAGGSAETRRDRLAAFGDAAYPGSGWQPSDPTVRSARERGLFEGWQPLPHSRREVERIATLYPPEAARTYLGAEATEEAAKALGSDARFLHFATHSYLDHRFPLDSAIVLTLPREPGEGRDNGLLQAWEIIEQMRIDADLVVLSACGSALGEEQGGEGLIGLTRAFHYAGARSVVASLWDVQDRATAELMVRFYRHLQSGRAIDEALRRAQRELIQGTFPAAATGAAAEHGDYSAPYYWAAFQIYGDWRATPRPSSGGGVPPPPAHHPGSRAARLNHRLGVILFVSRFDGSDDVVFRNEPRFYSSPGLPLQASSNGRTPGGWRAGRLIDGEHRGSDPWLITADGMMRYQGGQGHSSDALWIFHRLPDIPATWYLEVRFLASRGDLDARRWQFSIRGAAHGVGPPDPFRFAAGLGELLLNGTARAFLGLAPGTPHVARIWNLRDRALAEVYLAEPGQPEQLLGAVEASPSGILDQLSLAGGNYTASEFAVDHIVLRALDEPR